jgi:penicillin G amidase
VKWKLVAIALAVLVLAPLALVYGALRASLPEVDGEFPVSGVSAPVSIERDKLGVPTITASNRSDLAYATGFVHGQDRFFEMDLSRRLAAGELSELVGKIAIEQDESARLFRFRAVAREVLRQAKPEERALMEAYARGVNDGLNSLASRPWEYWALRVRPQPWLPEDSILVIHSMWWQLQYLGFHREILRQEVNASLGGPVCDSGWKCALSFFYPARTQWDAPAVGPEEPYVARDIPPPDVIDVRHATAATATTGPGRVANAPAPDAADIGSNNLGLAGRLTSTGAALVANDMHLTQRVPIVWYRARMRIAGSGGAPALDLTGATLPGAPVLVVGSNTHIAWGFTNSYGKWLDVTLVPCTAVTDTSLQNGSVTVPLQVKWEQIDVNGGPGVRLPVRSGPAGLLLEAHPEHGQCWFGDWLAQVPEATNVHLLELENARTTQEALALAPDIGIPHQNTIVGDSEGHIGWTIFGRIPTDEGPHRSGGRSPWTDQDSHPRSFDPTSGRLWSANARVTSDTAQEGAIGGDIATLGSEYDLGARARQVRDDLSALNAPATPADILRVQLDDRAVFLTRWRDLLLEVLDDEALRNNPARAELRKLAASWDARADASSVGYRIVRAWHDRTESAAWSMILGGLHIRLDGSFSVPSQFEAALWQLVRQQPMHLLAAAYPGWREFLLAQADATMTTLQRSCSRLDTCTWGRRNRISIRHPLSPALPFLAWLLDMPTVELPGDNDMPRVQGNTFGASERFAVSPGHEAEGYFHMPGGQSGHPLSPYYRAGFMEWARGEPLPFLPGASEHRATLRPLNSAR